MFQGPLCKWWWENIRNGPTKAAGSVTLHLLLLSVPTPTSSAFGTALLQSRLAGRELAGSWQGAARLFCIAARNNSTAPVASPSFFWSISPFAGFLPAPA